MADRSGVIAAEDWNAQEKLAPLFDYIDTIRVSFQVGLESLDDLRRELYATLYGE